MKQKTYNWMLYLITVVILGVVSIQFYWNYENYRNQESIFLNEIQLAFDHSIEDYYENLAKISTLENRLSIDSTTSNPLKGVCDALNIDSQVITYKSNTIVGKLDSSVSFEILMDSMPLTGNHVLEMKTNGEDNIWSDLVMKVISALQVSEINIDEVESNFLKHLDTKSIDLNYKIKMTPKTEEMKPSHDHIIYSKSALIPEKWNVALDFDSPSWQIIRQIKFGIILSFALIVSVLFCLYYLMFTIRKQKKISQIKNDLIGNITHEFKTPIATISVALEALRDKFGADNKNNKYFDISEYQLEKLNLMVEKLLETATLGKGSFKYSFSNFNINHTLTKVYDKASLLCTDEFVTLDLATENINFEGDSIHIENAIENIVDNALKYGGKRIEISSEIQNQSVVIAIEDDGNTLSPEDKELVFQSFYRKSVGNTHDIKGYGIGLYYSKSIIESHKGTLKLELNPTRFIIKLPYEKQ